MNIKIKLLNNKIMPPKQATEYSAGVDLQANLPDRVALHPGERRIIPTGIAIEIPVGLVGFICPRSGLAIKHGITVTNAPGVIDSDYRAEIGVVLENRGSELFWVNPSDRIAQMVFSMVCIPKWEIVDELSQTQRGEKGFGSTGK